MKALVAAIFIFFTMTLAAQQRYDRLLIHLDETHSIRALAALGIEVDHGQYRAGVSFTSDFSATEVQHIQAAGFNYEVLISDVSAYYASQSHQTPAVNHSRAAGCGTTTGYDVATPSHFYGGTMGGFYTYTEILAVLDSMHTLYPNLISARQPIDTFHSTEGRPIYWLRISNHPDSNQAAKPQILYTALHHAREPAGLTDLVFYMWHLLENYNASAEVKALLDNTEVYIIPCVNPDGYIYNQTTDPNGGGMWRKNRRLNTDGTYGVDLNRNYGFNWGYDNVGSSITTTDETYRGTAGFSEPEVQATSWFTRQHQFKIAINYHTYSNMLIYPWGYENGLLTPDSNLFIAYAKTMTKTNGFIYGTGDQTVGYTTNGDSDDWMYGDQVTKNKIFSMTPESGSQVYGFWPPASAVEDVARENFDLISYAHRFLLRHLEVADRSPKVITAKQFWFKYEGQRLGLDSTGSYQLFLTSSDPNIASVPAAIKTINNPALLATITDSFFITLNNSIASGSSFSFVLHVDNGQYSYTDTITKKYVGGDTIYYNNCNASSFFTRTGTWAVTTTSSTSPTGSVTDSPNGNYTDNSTLAVTINTIDLTAATSATLLYQAKWQLEKGFDYVKLEASTDNGSSWTSLCGQYTTQGVNQGDPADNVYDGYQTSWVQEVVDINSYVGQKVKLRFTLTSDPFVNYDGFYFDDLTILGTIDSTKINTSITDIGSTENWQLYPNPTLSNVRVSISALNGADVIITDIAGAVVRKTTIAESQIALEGIASGTYFLSIKKGDSSYPVKRLVVIK